MSPIVVSGSSCHAVMYPANAPSSVQGVDHVVPVDMYLPGCPPRPEMLIDAILKLHDQVQHKPLGSDARRAVEERETAALATAPTSQLKGLMR